jgi:Barstar (barnase inhibitor)
MRTYHLECSDISSQEDFWALYVRIVLTDGKGGFGCNLDALNDALWGGPGWPGACTIRLTGCQTLRKLEKGQFYKRLREITAAQDDVTFIWEEPPKQTPLVIAVIWLFPALILLGAFYANLVAIQEWRLAQSLARDGVQTIGTLDSRNKVQSLKTSASYRVAYRFVPKGAASDVRGDRPVDGTTFERVASQSRVAVVYLPTNLTKSDIVGNDVAFGATLFALVFDLILAAIGFALFRYRRRQSKH